MKATIVRQDLPGILIMFILGIGLTFLGTVKLKKAAETKNWPSVNGIITGSDVSSSGTKYYPLVNYSYTLYGIEYSSNTISNMKFNSKYRDYVEEYLQKYKPDSEIKVYYNSADPSQSLLEPGIVTGHYLLLAIGILILAIPALLLAFLKVNLKKE
jgi:hypothetical protein